MQLISNDRTVRNEPIQDLKDFSVKLALSSKAGSLHPKQNKKLSQNNKKWVACGFGILE